MRLAAALLALAATPAFAHRLDEYLQATLVSVDKNWLDAEMTLTPGVAVFPYLLPDIDTNRDGVLSTAEQNDYAARVLKDLSIASDGHRLAPRLTSIQFSDMAEMKEGRGQIRLLFSAALLPGYRDRELTIENRHQSRISAYLVNCLAPRDPHVQIVAQNRNYSQSVYHLKYRQTDAPLSEPWWTNRALWLCPVGLLLITRIRANLLQKRK